MELESTSKLKRSDLDKFRHTTEQAALICLVMILRRSKLQPPSALKFHSHPLYISLMFLLSTAPNPSTVPYSPVYTDSGRAHVPE